MDLKDIGFYTLSDERIRTTSCNSNMQRAELLVTEKCNFKCPYCRGTQEITQTLLDHINIVSLWMNDGLRNIRFSGGEPTTYTGLKNLILYANGCEHIAISTNGSAEIEYYKELIDLGVNDFSISLDACCASTGDIMAGGITGAWNKVIENIKELSKLTYVTVGVVITNKNINELQDTIIFAHELGVADIRIISAAQLNLELHVDIPDYILNAHPILKYRLQNNRMRGIINSDSHRCALVMDDSASCNGFHYPCIIYLREGGKPIGKISSSMRHERYKWFLNHDTHSDIICKNNCLDVCIDYNNKYRELRC
jgi:molybdenum cofactor biosynthesis enzyme MoaA